MIFKYKEKNYEVEIVRKNNKNTYIRTRNNKIFITTSYFTSDRRIKQLLETNTKTIEKMLDEVEILEKKKDDFFLFGIKYDIIYGSFEQKITITNDKIQVINEKVLYKWLDSYVRSIFYTHLMEWYNKFNGKVPCPNLKIRKMKTRWGVCNPTKKTVTLNSELFRYDIECLDYVIVHELAHFLVPNHSKKFWNVVEKFYPNYKDIKKKLRS